VIALAVTAAPATADDRARQPIGDQPAVLQLGPGWREASAAALAEPPALVMRHQDGALLAVTVAMAPNSEVYRTRKRAAWIADVVDGFEAAAGVKVTKKSIGSQGTVPSVDLWLERKTADGTETVAVRLLLFRTRTISVAVSGSSRKVIGAAMAALVPE